MSNNVYVVSALNEDGIVAMEVFTDKAKALDYEKNDIEDQVRREYSNAAVDSEHFQVTYSIRELQ